MPNAHSSREGWLRSPIFDLHAPSPPPRRTLSRFAYITKWMLAVTIGLGTLADPQPASAESLAEAPDDATKELLRRGFAASKKGDLEGAREAFAAAWERRQHFAVALSLAEVETSLGRFVEAAEHWQYVVGHLPDDLTEKRSFAAERLAECKTRIGTLTLRVTPDGSAIHVDGARVADSPLNRELYLPPGDHTVYAEKVGRRSVTRKVRLGAGSRLSFHLVVPSVPPAQASAAPLLSRTASSRTDAHTTDGQSSAGSLRTPVLVAGAALTLASAAVGTVFVWKSNGASDDAQGALEQAVAELIPVSETEARRFACNAVVVGRRVVTNSGCPELHRALSAEGFEPRETPLDEFVKAGGSAKCLTLRLDGEEAAGWKYEV